MRNGVTVTRLRGEAADDGYGGTIVDWSDPDRLMIENCALAPRVADELTARGRQGVVIGWTLYAPYRADITYRDRVETPDGLFEVDGEPGHWQSPYTGRRAGTTVALNRVEG